MLYDPDLFSVPAQLRAAHAAIRRECESLAPDQWIRWPSEVDVERGIVRVVPLYLKYRPGLLPPFADVELPARRTCPTTWALLQPIAVTAVLSRMQPGCRLRPHRDLDGPDHLRCHLGVSVAPGAWMRIGAARFEWTNGDCVVFDPRLEHEVVNDSPSPRTILIVDFVPSPAETSALLARGLPLPLP
ncbi:MAG: aspartyl/asparaginyl beta-hydroxylase domain-containing protein [Planctomycetes bacterium]|nr:aspartyl/asparaginyl beta-hydroxylase domain-containing protein [Planctomycetota bacterium]